MKRSSQAEIKIIFVFTIIILFSLSVFSYLRITKLIKAADLVQNTHRVKIVLEETFAELLQAETSQRGYLHSKDNSFLEELSVAYVNIDRHLLQIDSLTRKDPEQQRNLAALKIAVERRLTYLKRLLEDGKLSQLPSSRWLAGKSLMADVRNKITRMEQQQEEVINRDTQTLNKEASLTPLITFILIGFSLIILIAAYLRILSELRTSGRLQASLGQKTIQLENTNSELLQKNEETLAAIEKVKQNKEILRAQKKQLEDNNNALLKLNKELELFNYISSHDLQEPLRKIQIFASRIQANEIEHLSPKGKDDFSRMQDAANRMQSLIEDLLAYSRATTTDKTLVSTNLVTLVEDVKKSFAEEIEARNATVEINEMCEAKIIPFQFRQLMQNLLSNALKFSQPQTPVHIKIKSRIVDYKDLEIIDDNNNGQLKEGKYCHFTVCDNGIGFEPQYKDRIFEMFQRLHPNTTYQGTGIGLAIVKKIVENHSGLIHVTSQLNQGACFDIYLPD